MVYLQVQKSVKSTAIQKRQSPISPPVSDDLTQAVLQTYPRKKISTLPSKLSRDAIYRSIFGNLVITQPQTNSELEAERITTPVLRQENTSTSQTLQRFNSDMGTADKTTKIAIIKDIIHKTFGQDFSTVASPEQQQRLAEQGLTPEMATKVAQAINNFEQKKSERIARLKLEKTAQFQRYGYPIQEARLRAEKYILEQENFQDLENEAFKDLPPAYKPTPTDVKAKLLHDVKKQFFLEDNYDAKLNYANNSATKTSTSEKLKAYIKTGGSTIKTVAEVGGGISEKFTPNSNATKVFKGISNSIDVGTNITNAGFAIANIVEGTKKWVNKGDTVIKKEGKEQVIAGGIELKDNLLAATSGALYLAKTFGNQDLVNRLDVAGFPIFNIIANSNTLIHSAYEMGTATKQASTHKLLYKQAKHRKSYLEDAVEIIAKRMTHIAIRKAVDIVVNVIKLVGNTLNLGGITAVAGMVIKHLGTAINLGKKLGEQLVDSYQAGTAQEAAFNAKVNAMGAEEEIFQKHPKFAAAAIVVMAKQSDKLAINMLKTMGITESEIHKKSAKELREEILNISHFKEDARTITQQGKNKFTNTQHSLKQKTQISINTVKHSAKKLTETLPGQLITIVKSVKKFALIDSDTAAIISQIK